MHPSHVAGNAAFQSGDYKQSIEWYTQALLDEGGLTEQQCSIIRSNRAAAWLKLDNHRAALDDAQHATVLDPSNGKAWYRQACALAALQQPQEAHTAALHAAQLVKQPNADVDRLLHTLTTTLSSGIVTHAGVENTPADAGDTTTTTTTTNNNTQAVLRALLPPPMRDAIYIPTHHGRPYNILLLLHGVGDTQQPFASLARSMMLPDTGALACGGPCVVPETGGRAWFAVEWVDDDGGDGCSIQLLQDAKQRRVSITSTLQLLTATVHAVHRAGWPHQRIHLFGYGQGGTAALHAAQHLAAQGQPVGSCVAVCAAMLPDTDFKPITVPTQQQHKPTQVLLVHGVRDDALPMQHVQQTVQSLTRSGLHVQQPVALQRGAGMLSGKAEMRVVMKFWGGVLMAAPPEGAEEVGC